MGTSLSMAGEADDGGNMLGKGSMSQGVRTYGGPCNVMAAMLGPG